DVGGADFIELDVTFRVADFIEPGRKLQQVDLQHVAFPLVGSVLLGIQRCELLEVLQFLIGKQLRAACRGEAHENEGNGESVHAEEPFRQKSSCKDNSYPPSAISF